MGRIPDETVEQVRDTADLLEIVQESVQLKRQGSDYRGPCPFHGGTNRNFAVIPKKNLYYCFVCHAAGDVFTWYRERFGMDYPSAVREVARRYGIVIPDAAERAGPDPREPLYQACDAAQTWFAAQLRDLPEGEVARRYLLDREFSLDAAAEIGIGYAPRGNQFVDAMSTLGIGEPVLLDAALVMKRDDGTVYPRFRGRLLFPIHDLRGRVVGFGGRVLGAGEPKYLNSPETPIFHKGEQLYHIHLARNAIRKQGHAILVEGYFDVQRLAIAGIEHVVAPLGTATTEHQAALLKRYSNDVVLLYDSDPAGLKATFRAADVLLAHGLRVRVATMPPGEDPDTVVRRGGAAAIQPMLDDAVDVIERKLHLLELKGWFADAYRSREALDRLLTTLRAASDPVTKELYISRVAERLGVPRDTVATETAARQRQTPPPPRPDTARTAPPRPTRDAGASPGSRLGRAPTAEVERFLLRLFAHHQGWLDRARDELEAVLFVVPGHRRLYEALVATPVGELVPITPSGLDVRTQDVFDRIATLGPFPDDFLVDQWYVGSLEALGERALFESIAADPDRASRVRRRQALSPEGGQRYTWYLRIRSRPGEDWAPPQHEE